MWYFNSNLFQFGIFCLKESIRFIIAGFKWVMLSFSPFSFINNFPNLSHKLWLLLYNVVKSSFFFHHLDNFFSFKHEDIFEIVCSIKAIPPYFGLIGLICFSRSVSTLSIVIELLDCWCGFLVILSFWV